MGTKAEKIRKVLREDAQMARKALDLAVVQKDTEQMNYWTGAMVAFDRSVARASKIIGS